MKDNFYTRATAPLMVDICPWAEIFSDYVFLNTAMHTFTFQAHDMPYPYNHIYAEAGVRPCGTYNNGIVPSGQVPPPSTSRGYCNGMYGKEESTIYGISGVILSCLWHFHLQLFFKNMPVF